MLNNTTTTQKLNTLTPLQTTVYLLNKEISKQQKLNIDNYYNIKQSDLFTQYLAIHRTNNHVDALRDYLQEFNDSIILLSRQKRITLNNIIGTKDYSISINSYTIDLIKNNNTNYYFDKDTMRFFDSKLDKLVITLELLPGIEISFFIDSIQFIDSQHNKHPREYRIKYFNWQESRVQTCGDNKSLSEILNNPKYSKYLDHEKGYISTKLGYSHPLLAIRDNLSELKDLLCKDLGLGYNATIA